LQYVYAFGVFAVAAIVYALLSAVPGASGFLLQCLVLPATVALKIISAVFAPGWDLGWLDVDAKNTAAYVGRAVTFGASAVLVYVPAQLHRRRPTRHSLALAIAPWVFIAFSRTLVLSFQTTSKPWGRTARSELPI
jgi:hypothetical protein